MREHRGLQGFRFMCAVHDCDESHDVWAEKPHVSVNSYVDLPEGWAKDFGLVFCPTHSEIPAAHAKALKAQHAEAKAFMKQHHAAIKKAHMECLQAHPIPKPPWRKP